MAAQRAPEEDASREASRGNALAMLGGIQTKSESKSKREECSKRKKGKRIIIIKWWWFLSGGIGKINCDGARESSARFGLVWGSWRDWKRKPDHRCGHWSLVQEWLPHCQRQGSEGRGFSDLLLGFFSSAAGLGDARSNQPRQARTHRIVFLAKPMQASVPAATVRDVVRIVTFTFLPVTTDQEARSSARSK
ncbi:hypothetical protein P170DRAFT_427945 [Aspergillus steynii IBT 23096]|uniref:Uncharacterized protein n=1 Tax=Aspergillus steynii IBT 23096 TaxID=1392250 RepID=A0A2I2G192_9EURO|nr:uncharacterized protein P170DRAFT_427945 [Aspergillus steynii IBT 23096]PLB46644.1 hypothetical protein P170DRAFT_427945 [Aspergillus steynii IBT 23096]